MIACITNNSAPVFARSMLAVTLWSGFLLTCLVLPSHSLRLTGDVQASQIFKLLGRFGVQSTVPNNVIGTRGYIYGSVTSESSVKYPLKLIVADSEYFMSMYEGSLHTKSACSRMMNKTGEASWNPVCNVKSHGDFIRTVPCPDGGICYEETYGGNPLAGFQFTYRIQTKQDKFYYISLVACHQNETDKDCRWFPSYPTPRSKLHIPDSTIHYDIWLVNGDPDAKHMNPFEHQFSFEMFDVLEIYLVTALCLCSLLIAQTIAYRRQRIGAPTAPALPPALLITSVSLELVGAACNLIHSAKFSSDGVGAFWLAVGADAVDSLSECFIILLLLLVAKGWRITFKYVTRRRVLSLVWSTFFIASFAMFVWMELVVDEVVNIYRWGTTPAYITLGLRGATMFWYMFELQRTHQAERRQKVAGAYVTFSAGFLVWFIYLPILAFISQYLDPLWRYKTMLSFTCGADVAVLFLLILLLWPGKYVPLEGAGNAETSIACGERKGLVSQYEEDSSEDEIYDRQRKVFRKHNMGNGHVHIPDLLRSPPVSNTTTVAGLPSSIPNGHGPNGFLLSPRSDGGVSGSMSLEHLEGNFGFPSGGIRNIDESKL